MTVVAKLERFDQHASDEALARIFAAEDALPEKIIDMLEDLNEVMGKSLSDSTRAAYRSDWTRFQRWCDEFGAVPMPALGATVAAYLVSSMKERVRDEHGKEVPAYSTATLRRWLASINQMHARAGMPKPISDERVPIVMAGIARELGSQQRRATPLHRDDIYEIIERRCDPKAWPDGVSATRDAALLALGYVGAFRRKELSELQVRDIVVDRMDGLHVRLRKSKTDQEGHGQVKAVPYGRRGPATCPVCAIWRWIGLIDVADKARQHGDKGRGSRQDTLPPGGEAARRAAMRYLLKDGPSWSEHICRAEEFTDRPGDARPLFRQISNQGLISERGLSGFSIGEVVKKRVAQIGLRAERYSGHSLRAGFITDAYRHGADDSSIRRQTGHASPAMLEIYRREHSPMVGNAIGNLGF